MKLDVLIVDDEPVARSAVRRLVESDPDVATVGECANANEALARLGEKRPDVLFLDIEMPGMSGVDLLRSLSAHDRPSVIFTTAYGEFATTAFDERATDYLLKPFTDERLRTALDRAKETIKAARAMNAQVEATEGAAPPAYAQRLSIHHEGRIELVDLNDVEWIQSADQYVRIHTLEGEHLMRASMGELERMLDPAHFVRAHRSAIVPIARVRRLETRAGGTGRLLLAGGAWVPVSRAKIPYVRRLLS